MTDADPPSRSATPRPVRAVVKFGGEVVARTSELAAMLTDVATLSRTGWTFALCHGGGPQANALQARLGVPTVKVGGRRVTDDATLQIMKCVLAGEVSVDVVAAASAAGLAAVGLGGVSAGLVTATRRPPKVVSGAGPEPVDFGHVGDVVEVKAGLVEHLWRGGYTPVVSSLGIAAAAKGDALACEVFNINADTVAAALAAALAVDHLFLVTDVPGVLRDRDDPSSRIPVLAAADAREAIERGVIVGGMIPKIEEALANLERGIGAVHILPAERGALAGAASTPGSRGTVLVSSPGGAS
jgi:acetylglutamate kinase